MGKGSNWYRVDLCYYYEDIEIEAVLVGEEVIEKSK